MSDILGFSFFPEITYKRLQVLSKKYQGDLELAWNKLSFDDLRLLGINALIAEKILAKKKDIYLQKYRQKLIDNSVEVIDIYSPKYPKVLREIYDPPIVLYKKGSVDIDELNSIAIVGTRKPTPYGLRAVEDVVCKLSQIDCAVVSGMALGIDTRAHWTAVNNKIKTIAVLGTGVDVAYPWQNKKLAQSIAENGALISEYPLGEKPLRWHFPRRNRIITGLSKAVLVVEGGIKSGALISGKVALAQNRDVYALPGNIYSEMSAGSNWLIEQGARPLLSGEQILSEVFSQTDSLFKSETKKEIDLNKDEKYLYEQIMGGGSILVDDLFEATQQDYAAFTKSLLSLELKGVIAQLPGKRVVGT